MSAEERPWAAARLRIAKGTERAQPGEQTRQEPRTQQEERGFPAFGLRGDEGPGAPFCGAPPQLGLFLCYCAVNKWLDGRRLRLCRGKPGVEPVREPGLTVRGVCGESNGTHRSPEPPALKGLRSLQGHSALGNVTAGASEMATLGSFLNFKLRKIRLGC